MEMIYIRMRYNTVKEKDQDTMKNQTDASYGGFRHHVFSVINAQFDLQLHLSSPLLVGRVSR